MDTISRGKFLVAAGATALTAPLINLRPANAAEFVYKYANDVPASHPLTVWVTKAATAIRDESGGRIEIQVFSNNQLGGDTNVLSQLRAGAIQFFTLSGLILSTLVPAASINGIGFAFEDYKDVWAAMDGELGAYVRGAISKAGLFAFDKIWDSGYREITSSSHPINSPEDLKGFKIRVPISPLWTSMFKALGAAPAGINFNEVYSALQTKVVDGQETPLVSIEAAKLYEVQKYCSLTNHMWDGFWFLANQAAWLKLPKNLQEIVLRNMNDAAVKERADVRAHDGSLESKLKSEGLVFNKPASAPFREVLSKAGFYAQWKNTYGAEPWGLLEKYAGTLG